MVIAMLISTAYGIGKWNCGSRVQFTKPYQPKDEAGKPIGKPISIGTKAIIVDNSSSWWHNNLDLVLFKDKAKVKSWKYIGVVCASYCERKKEGKPTKEEEKAAKKYYKDKVEPGKKAAKASKKNKKNGDKQPAPKKEREELDNEKSWACLKCTSINHGALPACEVCGASRSGAASSQGNPPAGRTTSSSKKGCMTKVLDKMEISVLKGKPWAKYACLAVSGVGSLFVAWYFGWNYAKSFFSSKKDDTSESGKGGKKKGKFWLAQQWDKNPAQVGIAGVLGVAALTKGYYTFCHDKTDAKGRGVGIGDLFGGNTSEADGKKSFWHQHGGWLVPLVILLIGAAIVFSQLGGGDQFGDEEYYDDLEAGCGEGLDDW